MTYTHINANFTGLNTGSVALRNEDGNLDFLITREGDVEMDMFASTQDLPVKKTLSSSSPTLVFIDAGVEDYQFLAKGVISEARAFILGRNRDGIKQITEILSKYPEVDSIHLVSHGSPGSLQLGNAYLSLDTLAEYRSELQTWSAKSLLLYGCNIAAGDTGEEFIAKLHQLTCADIAASQTKTGNSDLGGNWDLEVQTERLVVNLAFHNSTIANYPFTLVERVSVASDGTEGNGWSYNPSISADGRYVTFTSSSDNLVSGDTNFSNDIFVHDRQTGTTERVSVASDGTEGNLWSYNPSISADGRYVTFISSSDNLVSGDTNASDDLFVHDRQTSTTERVSVASDSTGLYYGAYSPSISADGRYVTFQSPSDNLVSGDTNFSDDIFVHDHQTGTTERVSVASDGTEGNGYSHSPSISADGRYVTFISSSDNLVSGDTNAYEDIFVHDRQTGTTERVSVASDGTEGNGWSYNPSISADGRYVTFISSSDNLVSGDTNVPENIFVHDRQTGTTERVSVASDDTGLYYGAYDLSISADGRYVTFQSPSDNLVSGDTNGSDDIFVVANPLVNPSDILGTPEDDYLLGSASGESIAGLAGSDFLIGDGGNDELYGGEDVDLLEAGDGNDILDGGDGDDLIFGDAGDDLMIASPGSDTFDGGSGQDTADFSSNNEAISLYFDDLTPDEHQTLVDKGTAGIDEIFDVETIIGPSGQANTIGGFMTEINSNSLSVDLNNNTVTVSYGDPFMTHTYTVLNFNDAMGTPEQDILTGSDENNHLTGYGGNDVLNGLAGEDTLTGVDTTSDNPGAGERDLMFGGLDGDIFVLGTNDGVFYLDGAEGDSLGREGMALIRDFVSGVDKIQLSGVAEDYVNLGSFLFADNGSKDDVLDRNDDLIAFIQDGFDNSDMMFV